MHLVHPAAFLQTTRADHLGQPRVNTVFSAI
jgi:hypothetical protein